jgi:pimeloyl-ACP methyl ester carboxylesterase
VPEDQLDGIEIHYRDEGSGRPLLLVHGFPLTHAMWSQQIATLSDTYRVIAPDLRGFGGSPFVEGEIGMETYGADLSALLDHLGLAEPIAMAGFSMGGYVLLALLREQPGRVDRLALIDTKATADSPEAKAGRLAAAESVLVDGSGVVARGMIEKLFAPATREARPNLEAELLEMMSEQAPGAVAQALLAMASRPDSMPLLAALEVPTMVIVGSEDVIATPEEARWMADEIPGAQLVEIAGAGHMAPVERPDAVNRALASWLADA